MALLFEWDPTKAASNLARHGVSFAEAVSIFADPLARIFPDSDHSASEERELLVGHSSAQRLLVVSFVEREDGIRLIGARPTSRRERKDYEESLR